MVCREQVYYINIMPGNRNGRTVIRGEVREKEGGRFRSVASWDAPPVDRKLWDSEQLRPRMSGYEKDSAGQK